MRQPVFLPHVRTDPHVRWPLFGQAVLETGVEALFVYPLLVGALDVGVVELYSSSPGALDRADQARAAVLADGTAWDVLGRMLSLNQGEIPGSAPVQCPLSRRETLQATGMVLAQTSLSATDALLLMRAHAFSQNRTLRDVAHDVVARVLDFTPQPG